MLRVAGTAGVLAGASWNIELVPGMRIYLVSVVADAALAGAIELENGLFTIPAGTTFTLGGADMPRDCDAYRQTRVIRFIGTLGAVSTIIGPVDHTNVKLV